MNAKIDELLKVQAETVKTLDAVAENQKKISKNQEKGVQAIEKNAIILGESSDKIESYRVSIGPSLIGVAGKIESAAQKQVEAAQINAKSIDSVVKRMDEQEIRHREEIKEERKRQDDRDDRYFTAMKELSNDVKENTKISLETSHQVTTLTQALQDQCKLLTSTQNDVKELQISMAVAKSKWAIIGTAGGIIGTALVGLIFKVWGGK